MTSTSVPLRASPVLTREELERQCWSWVEALPDLNRGPCWSEDGEDQYADVEGQITAEMVGKAYRLHFPTHFYPQEQCKRNCRFNPR